MLSLITARQGSKGLVDKNVRLLGKDPLIAYSIKASLAARGIHRTLVSTDGVEIADIAQKYGAEVPFFRPLDLSQDDTSIYPVLIHALNWLQENEQYYPTYVMLLQPTSPLRTPEDIENAIQIAVENDADAVVSLAPVKQHPFHCKSVNEQGLITGFLDLEVPPDLTHYRRQTVPETFAPNGAIYLVKSKVLIEQGTFYTNYTYAYKMPFERSVDIDSELDLRIAGLILKEDTLN